MTGRYGIFVSMVGAVVGLSLLAWRLSAVQDVREAAGAVDPQAQVAAFGSEDFGYADAVGQAQLAVSSAKLAQAMAAAQALRAYEGDLAVTTEALRGYDPTIDATTAVFLTSSGLCIQTGQGGSTVHLSEYEPVPSPGPCT